VRGLRAFFVRVAGVFGRSRQERELAEELETHLQMHTEDNVRAGMAPEEARRQAALRLGGLEATKESLRDRRRVPFVETALRDLRFAARSLRKSPGFTAITIATLALGIGANTAIFTLVHAVMIEPLPFRVPDRIVVVWEENRDRPGRPNVISPSNFIRWQERSTAFESMSAFVDFRAALTGQSAPEELVAMGVMSNFFSTLGAAPLLGRTFAPEEGPEGHDSVTVLSHGLWQRRFGGDPAIVGRTIQLNGRPFTVIGVMPPRFGLFLKNGSLVGRPAELWEPFAFTARHREPRGRYMSAVARLAPGKTLEEARAQMKTIAAGLVKEFPDHDTGWTVSLVPVHREMSGAMRPVLVVLFGAVAFVLLIACANVASLLLARGTSRVRELAIRTALGASRARVLWQLMAENLLLALLGGAFGLLFARWGVQLLLALSPADLTTLGRIHLSAPVLGFTALVSVLTAAICGLAPALAGSRADVQDSLKEGARQGGAGARTRRLRKVFVVSEIALAVVLLVGAGLMLRSLRTLGRVDPGFAREGILTARVNLPTSRYKEDPEVMRFFAQALERIRAIPGVRAAGAVSFLPFAGLAAATDLVIIGDPAPPKGQEPGTEVRVCDNGYFGVMGIRLLRGRLFTDLEQRQNGKVVVVSESFARDYFPGREALGRQIKVDMSDENVPMEIVGIVSDIRHADLVTPPRPVTYYPIPQLVYNGMTLTIRTDGDPLAAAPAVERTIHSIDKDQPVSDVRSMDQWIATSLARERFGSTLLVIFATLALLLAAIGIYGVMSYAVGQRTAEFGIRAALGADARDIRSMILRDGGRLVLAGLAIGTPLALLLGRAVTRLLYETRWADPVTFAAVLGLLAAVALLASYLPARRAARVAPVEALRHS
jgi:putative ABC transport system permease protein